MGDAGDREVAHRAGRGRVSAACARCGAVAGCPDGGLPAGWSLASSTRGVDRLCAACTRANVRAIEARLDEEWW